MPLQQHPSTDTLQVPRPCTVYNENKLNTSGASILSTQGLDQDVETRYLGVTHRDLGYLDERERPLPPKDTESEWPISDEPRNTQSAEPNTLDSSSNGRPMSLKTGGSQVLRLVRRGWAKLKEDKKDPEPRVYLGLRWEDVKHPFDRAKEHRARANRGYSSTFVDPQTTRRSVPESSMPNVPKQPRTDLSFSGTAAASLPPSNHLPDDPEDVSRPLSPSDSQSFEGYDGSGWNFRAYYANPRGEAEFDQADSND